MLLYSDGMFFQYIEGPLNGLSVVYEATLRDPLHHRIFELIREPINQREFPDWSMGYQGMDVIEGTTEEGKLSSLLMTAKLDVA